MRRARGAWRRVDQQPVAVAPGDRGRAGRRRRAVAVGRVEQVPEGRRLRVVAAPLDQVLGRDPPRSRDRVRGQQRAHDRAARERRRHRQQDSRGCRAWRRAPRGRTCPRGLTRSRPATARRPTSPFPLAHRQRDRAAERVAGHVRALEPESGGERRDAVREPLDGVRPLRRGAEARQVERDHLALAREQRHDRPPHHVAHPEPVHQQQRRPRPGAEVRQVHAADDCHATR